MKKKILFILNTYDFMSTDLNNNLSLEENYKIFNKLDKSWANFFYNNLKKNYKVKKIYPQIDKKFISLDNFLKKKNNCIKRFKPDFIFNTTNDLKIHFELEKFKSAKKMIWISHKVNENNLISLSKIYDYLITYNSKLISMAKKNNFKYFKLMISSPKVFESKLENYKKRSDKIYFTGSLGHNFTRRLEYLTFLYNNFNLKLRLRNLIEKYKFLNFSNSVFLKIFPNIMKYFFKKKILPLTNKLKYINEDEIFGEKLINELKKHKICININSDFDKDVNINLRVFEALSCGCLLFTDRNKAMKNIFKNRRHVVYFDTKEDLKKKINYYKKNIDECFKISQRGNYLFNKKYHSIIRLNEFKKILKKIDV